MLSISALFLNKKFTWKTQNYKKNVEKYEYFHNYFLPLPQAKKAAKAEKEKAKAMAMPTVSVVDTPKPEIKPIEKEKEDKKKKKRRPWWLLILLLLLLIISLIWILIAWFIVSITRDKQKREHNH